MNLKLKQIFDCEVEYKELVNEQKKFIQKEGVNPSFLVDFLDKEISEETEKIINRFTEHELIVESGTEIQANIFCDYGDGYNIPITYIGEKELEMDLDEFSVSADYQEAFSANGGELIFTEEGKVDYDQSIEDITYALGEYKSYFGICLELSALQDAAKELLKNN